MRILFAANNLPFPPTSGGAQRTELLLRSLQPLGSVDCVFLQPRPPQSHELTELHQRCRLKLVVSTQEILARRPAALFRSLVPGRLGQDLEAFADGGRFRWNADSPSIAQLGSLSDYDLVVVRYLQTAVTLGLFGSVPVALDVDDYDPDRIRLRLLRANLWKKLSLRRALRFSEIAHKRFLPLAAHRWVSNPGDRNHPLLKEATLLPNIPYPDAAGNIPPALPVKRTSKIFLMVGTMSYSANADGVEAFLREAWPQVIHQFPEAQFHIVGMGVSEKQRAQWSQAPGVRVIGFVKNLEEVYGECLAVLAPIQTGGGTNIKVLEAAAFGRAVILTEIAHRGFDTLLPPASTCLRSRRVVEMGSHCIALLKDPAKADVLGRAARKAIKQDCSFEAFKSAVHLGCESAMRRKGSSLQNPSAARR